MFKYVALIFFIVGCFFFPVYASESSVVINSFRISGESSTDEYIEISNFSALDVDIMGWRLAKKTASGNISNLVTSFPQIYIEPGASIIVSHLNCKCSSDITYSTSGSIADDNTILLFSDSGKTLVDKVGFGLASDFEGSPTYNPNDFEVYKRKNDGQDTENNKNDFFLFYAPSVAETKPSPKTKDSKEEFLKDEVKAPVQVIVTEFLPNPEGADSEQEFIEIKNIGKKVDIGGYYLADTLGSPKFYKIPAGTIISEGQYLAFYSSKIPISLNNDGDGVQFMDPSKKSLDSSPDDCGKAPEGASYALGANGKWVWTETVTPGKENIIKQPIDESIEVGNDGEDSITKLDFQEIENEEVKGDFYTKNDRVIGIALLVVVIVFGLGYTFYNNKEKIFEFYKLFREKHQSTGEKIRRSIKGR
jgi:hypothetical protein